MEVAQRRAVGGSSVGLVGWTLDVGQTNEGSNGTGRFTYILNLVDFLCFFYNPMDQYGSYVVDFYTSPCINLVDFCGKCRQNYNQMDPMGNGP